MGRLPTGWLLAILLALLLPSWGFAQAGPETARQKIIIDTDIGDDIDDAFALALALSSPEFEILGVSTAWGDTQLRGRVAERMLCETGREDIPVTAGPSTEPTTVLDHAPWARAFWKPVPQYPSGVDFLLAQIRKY